MGYYANYSLTFTSLDEGLGLSSKEEIEQRIVDYIKEIDPNDDGYLSAFIIKDKFYSDPDEMKWYGHDGDMLAMSMAIPAVVFELNGIGEDNETWRKYFYRGKMQVALPTTTYPPMDVEYLMGLKDTYKDR